MKITRIKTVIALTLAFGLSLAGCGSDGTSDEATANQESTESTEASSVETNEAVTNEAVTDEAVTEEAATNGTADDDAGAAEGDGSAAEDDGSADEGDGSAAEDDARADGDDRVIGPDDDEDLGAGDSDGDSGSDEIGDAAPTFDPDAPLLTESFTLLDEGPHRVDTLGTPFSFVVDEPLFVQPNGGGWIVLTAPDSAGPDDRDIFMLRLSALSDPASPTTQWATFEDGWPADDFDGWLDNLPADIVVTDRTDTSLGGLDAVRVDIELGESISCRAGPACAYFGTNNLNGLKGFIPGSSYRIWVADQGDEAPLAVIVGINRDDQADWFETADRVLATLVFGDLAPNPLQLEEAGTADLPVLGGVTAELARASVFIDDQRGFYLGYSDLEPVITAYLVNPRDVDGGLLATIDDLVTYLGQLGIDVAELDSVAVDGIPTRVFDISDGPQPTDGQLSTVFKFSADAAAGWRMTDQVRLWVLDHPERGLVAVSAAVFGPASDGVYPALLTEVEAMLASLQFIDVG